MNSDGNVQPLDLEQLNGSTNTVQNGRFSISPRSSLNGVERKKSWGRNVSIRASSSQLFTEERQDAAKVAPRFVRASTWVRERRASSEDNGSPDCISSFREPNDGKSFVHAQVLACATPLGLHSGNLHAVLIGQVFSSQPVLCPLNFLIPCGDFCLMHGFYYGRSSCSRNGGAYHLSLTTTGRNEKTCRSGVWVKHPQLQKKKKCPSIPVHETQEGICSKEKIHRLWHTRYMYFAQPKGPTARCGNDGGMRDFSIVDSNIASL
jgi:hypothetical protein